MRSRFTQFSLCLLALWLTALPVCYGALGAGVNWEVEGPGSATVCSGGMDPGTTTGMLSNGAVSSANTSAPVLSSASLTVTSGMAGHWAFIGAGSNAYFGWYLIATANTGANNLTLSAAAGAGTLYPSGTLTTATGVGSVSSLSSITFTIDYSYGAGGTAMYAPTTLTDTTNNTVVAYSGATPDMARNLIFISTSTNNWTSATYEIVSVVAGTSITLDRAPCSAATTGNGTGYIGGATTLAQAASTAVASNRVWLQYYASLYTTASSIAPTAVTWFTGYDLTRGDCASVAAVNAGTVTRPTIQASASLGGTTTGIIQYGALTSGKLENIILDANSQSTTSCVTTGSANNGTFLFSNLLFKGFTTSGYYGDFRPYTYFLNCEFTSPGNTVSNYGVTCGTSSLGSFDQCYFHDYAGGGISSTSNGMTVVRSIFANLTGTGSYALTALPLAGTLVEFNDFFGITGDAIHLTVGIATQIIRNNVFVNGGAYGINSPVTSPANLWSPWYGNNAYYNNTSGNTSDFPLGPTDIILTGVPWAATISGGSLTNSNFALNSTAGAGLACQGAAAYSSWGSAGTTGYADLGAVQHQSSGGASGTQRRVME